jgi:hypothetical protein
VLEVLRDWPRYSERDWPEFVSSVARLSRRGEVDIHKIKTAAVRERHAAARERAAQLTAALQDGRG